jgi:Type II secretion system (T2SS), protein F
MFVTLPGSAGVSAGSFPCAVGIKRQSGGSDTVFKDDLVHGLAMAVAAIAVAVGLGALVRRPAVRTMIDRVALRPPGIGGLVRQASTALFARTLGTLLHNGVSLLPALDIAASVVPSRTVGGAIAEAAEHVKEGRRLAEALQRTGIFSDLALRFVAIGEEASRLDRMLLHLAEISDKATQSSIDRAMTLLSPVLTIAIGALIGGIFVSVIQARAAQNREIAFAFDAKARTYAVESTGRPQSQHRRRAELCGRQPHPARHRRTQQHRRPDHPSRPRRRPRRRPPSISSVPSAAGSRRSPAPSTSPDRWP